ncbi:TIGR01457 family HAD-type hydrolase [Kurthia huakuii]|uniref:TIGR01457 family HAD-type hydrolase n=1 Tax=Kurthia huakuii TaxID=1421019 RepID=UPI0004959895|nr:TIGR01457 family HAD-type hydrolase [Kurthia huakuii]MBM7700261.1 4-nitrophenyl phosphatase [Kurthia huakuii]
MKTYEAYCFDLDGTVYRGAAAIPEAVAFIHHLQAQGIEPFYVTNNAKYTQAAIQQKLAVMNLVVPAERIMTSSIATAKYIAKHYPNQTVKVLGQQGLQQAIAAENIRVVSEQPDIVAQGLTVNISYEALEDICYDIQNGAKHIATNGDLKLPNEHGFAPGNGSFVQLVQNVTGVEPLYIGKPAPHMLEIIRDSFGFTKADMLMIGDNYDTDILVGIDYGIDTLHVDTGVTRQADVQTKQAQPTYYAKTLAAWL